VDSRDSSFSLLARGALCRHIFISGQHGHVRMKAFGVNSVFGLLTGELLSGLSFAYAIAIKRVCQQPLNCSYSFSADSTGIDSCRGRYHKPSHIFVVKKLQHKTGLLLYLYFIDGPEIIVFLVLPESLFDSVLM
jgi:hypothetical protein